MADIINTIGFLCSPSVDKVLKAEDLGLTDLESYKAFLNSLKFSREVQLQYFNSSHLIILFKRFLIKNNALSEFDKHDLYQYLQNIDGVLSGSIINASIILSKIMSNFSDIKTAVRVIIPFSLTHKLFDDFAYITFLNENKITVCPIIDRDEKSSGVIQSIHFDCESQRYILWGRHEQITQIPDFEQKLRGLKKFVIEGMAYKDNMRVIDNAIITANQMGIDVDFILSIPYIVGTYRENLMQQISQKRIKTIIGVSEEILSLLGDENYSEIQNFSKVNNINILEIGETEIRFIDKGEIKTSIDGIFDTKYKIFFLAGFYAGEQLGLNIEKSLNMSITLGSLKDVSISDIFYIYNHEFLKCLKNIIPERLALLTKNKAERCICQN